MSTACEIEGCDRRLKYPKYGWCGAHYEQWRKHGDPLFRKPRVSSPWPPRFWAKVKKGDGCWLWTAAKNSLGYGAFDNGTGVKPAHRLAYELSVGPIPPGLQLDHLCRNPPCVNPAHLEPVTARENTLRGLAPSAFNAVKTHCKRGHPFDEANTYVYVEKSGRVRRICRTCTRAADQARRSAA